MVVPSRVLAPVLAFTACLRLWGQWGVPFDPALVAQNPIRVYDERDGIASFPIECIAQDTKGYLWVGTQDGIRKYNGHIWTPIPLPDAGLNLWVVSIHASEDGSVWFGTNGNGLYRIKDGLWTCFTQATGFPGISILSLAETRDRQGQPCLWVGTSREGLWCCRNGQMTKIQGSRGQSLESVRALLPGPDGTLWAGTRDGVYEIRDGIGSPLPAPARRAISQVTCLAKSASGLWVGMETGLARFTAGKWTFFGTKEGLPSPFVTVLRVDQEPDGTEALWAGTYRGLVIQRKGRWQRLWARAGLPNAIIRCLLITHEKETPGQVWIGTFSGLVRLSPGRWLSFTGDSGLAETAIFSILEDEDHSFWFGTGRGGVLHLTRGSWSSVDTIEGRPFHAIYALCRGTTASGKKVIYAGGRDPGLAVLEDGRWHLWEHNRELPDPNVFAILETRNPAGEPILWVGTRRGLLRSGPEGRTVLLRGGGLGQDHVDALAETIDPDGTSVIWAGTRGEGLSRYRHGQWETFNKVQGLTGKWITSLTVIRDGAGKPWIWAGTQSDGALRIDPDHPERPWTFLKDLVGGSLPSQMAVGIQSDAQHRLYVFTLGGIIRLTPDGSDHFSSYSFTTGDGLPSNACTMASSTVDSAGRIWTGTVSGAAFLDPRNEPADTRAKPLYFETCQALGSPGPLTEGQVLSHKQNSLQFEFSLLSYYREDDTRFRVQLEGLDAQPGPWKTEARQEYAALPDGSYTLKVWAKDYAGNISGPIQRSFQIRPAPWRHPLAWLLYGTLAVLGGWQISRYRLHLLRKRNLLLQTRVRRATRDLLEREQQLQIQAERLATVNSELRLLDEQKTRFLGIAAHDLRNPLSGIVLTAKLIQEGIDPENTERNLDGIITEARNMADLVGRFLEISSIESGKLNPELETVDLKDLVMFRVYGIQPMAMAKNISLVLEAPEDGLQVRCDPKLTTQVLDNLLSNALKFSQGGTLVQVSLEDTGATGRIAVTDQGPGLSDEDKRKIFGRFARLSAVPTAGESSTGLGLSIVKNLVEAMGGTIRVESIHGQGASFIVDLPKA